MCRECKGTCDRFKVRLAVKVGYLTHNLCRTCSDFRDNCWMPKSMGDRCVCCHSFLRTKPKNRPLSHTKT